MAEIGEFFRQHPVCDAPKDTNSQVLEIIKLRGRGRSQTLKRLPTSNPLISFTYVGRLWLVSLCDSKQGYKEGVIVDNLTQSPRCNE